MQKDRILEHVQSTKAYLSLVEQIHVGGSFFNLDSPQMAQFTCESSMSPLSFSLGSY